MNQAPKADQIPYYAVIDGQPRLLEGVDERGVVVALAAAGVNLEEVPTPVQLIRELPEAIEA